MRGLIEAGVVLFVVYLFLQWEKNGGAAGAIGTSGGSSFFNEAPGSPVQGLINESATPGTAGNTATTTTAKSHGGCGCGGNS
jgi:hypothetical protein